MEYRVLFEGRVEVDGRSPMSDAKAQADLERQCDKIATALAEVTGGNFDIGATMSTGKLEITIFVEAGGLNESITAAMKLIMEAFRRGVGAHAPMATSSGFPVPVAAVAADRELIGA